MKKAPAPRSFSEAGFTLIETIVVVSVIALVLPVVSAIILILMQQQIKIYRLSQVKGAGDYVINLMENTIRNRAVTIHSSSIANDTDIVCQNVETYPLSGTADHLYFLDENNRFFGYKLNGTTIASDSAHPADLTSSKVVVDSFSISCSRSSVYSPAVVLLNFDICYETCTPSTRPEEIASIHYQSRIKLRNQ